MYQSLLYFDRQFWEAYFSHGTGPLCTWGAHSYKAVCLAKWSLYKGHLETSKALNWHLTWNKSILLKSSIFVIFLHEKFCCQKQEYSRGSFINNGSCTAVCSVWSWIIKFSFKYKLGYNERLLEGQKSSGTNKNSFKKNAVYSFTLKPLDLTYF